MPREYLGILSNSNTGVPLSLYPALWLVEDDHGGFCRFETKMVLNHLKYTCSLKPARTDEVATVLSSLVSDCRSHGIVSPFIQTNK